MEKKDLIKLLDEIFVPLGFKRKGHNWVLNGDELSKLINLQKSNYSNAFYINLLNDLRKRLHLNNIPLVVKRHFNLPE